MKNRIMESGAEETHGRDRYTFRIAKQNGFDCSAWLITAECPSSNH